MQQRKPHKKNAKTYNPAKGNKGVPSSKPVEWNDEHQKSLDHLVDMVTSAPILAYPDYTQRFFVHTDASSVGLGAILYQEKGGVVRVLGYGSRTLKPAEKMYHSTKLETLALKWTLRISKTTWPTMITSKFTPTTTPCATL